jgi:anthranilate phosphoribosyltransferase
MNGELQRLQAGQTLGEEEMYRLISAIVAGQSTEEQIEAFLLACNRRQPTPEELAGAAKALLSAAQPFPCQESCADSCGTGGDGVGSLNISTAAALVAAAAGLPVAKHGNRSVSSRSGSADVLEQLGFRIDPCTELAQLSLKETGFCFLFAPLYHSGVRHAMPVRRRLGVRTIFNLLGPLVNPAHPAFHLLGVAEPDLVPLLAETCARLGTRRALVVHGSGMDELAIHGPSSGLLLENGRLSPFACSPAECGLPVYDRLALAGGDPRRNAEELEALLQGRGRRAYRDAVALNAGALLWLAGMVADLPGGVARAGELIDAGSAVQVLARGKELSHGPR